MASYSLSVASESRHHTRNRKMAFVVRTTLPKAAKPGPSRHEVVAVARARTRGGMSSSNRRARELERVCLSRVRASWSDPCQLRPCRARLGVRRCVSVRAPPPLVGPLPLGRCDPSCCFWMAPERTPWSHDLAATEHMPVCDRPLVGWDGRPGRPGQARPGSQSPTTVGHWCGASSCGRNRRDVQ